MAASRAPAFSDAVAKSLIDRADKLVTVDAEDARVRPSWALPALASLPPKQAQALGVCLGMVMAPSRSLAETGVLANYDMDEYGDSLSTVDESDRHAAGAGANNSVTDSEAAAADSADTQPGGGGGGGAGAVHVPTAPSSHRGPGRRGGRPSRSRQVKELMDGFDTHKERHEPPPSFSTSDLRASAAKVASSGLARGVPVVPALHFELLHRGQDSGVGFGQDSSMASWREEEIHRGDARGFGDHTGQPSGTLALAATTGSARHTASGRPVGSLSPREQHNQAFARTGSAGGSYRTPPVGGNLNVTATGAPNLNGSPRPGTHGSVRRGDWDTSPRPGSPDSKRRGMTHVRLRATGAEDPRAAADTIRARGGGDKWSPRAVVSTLKNPVGKEGGERVAHPETRAPQRPHAGSYLFAGGDPSGRGTPGSGLRGSPGAGRGQPNASRWPSSGRSSSARGASARRSERRARREQESARTAIEADPAEIVRRLVGKELAIDAEAEALGVRRPQAGAAPPTTKHKGPVAVKLGLVRDLVPRSGICDGVMYTANGTQVARLNTYTGGPKTQMLVKNALRLVEEIQSTLDLPDKPPEEHRNVDLDSPRMRRASASTGGMTKLQIMRSLSEQTRDAVDRGKDVKHEILAGQIPLEVLNAGRGPSAMSSLITDDNGEFRSSRTEADRRTSQHVRVVVDGRAMTDRGPERRAKNGDNNGSGRARNDTGGVAAYPSTTSHQSQRQVALMKRRLAQQSAATIQAGNGLPPTAVRTRKFYDPRTGEKRVRVVLPPKQPPSTYRIHERIAREAEFKEHDAAERFQSLVHDGPYESEVDRVRREARERKSKWVGAGDFKSSIGVASRSIGLPVEPLSAREGPFKRAVVSHQHRDEATRESALSGPFRLDGPHLKSPTYGQRS